MDGFSPVWTRMLKACQAVQLYFQSFWENPHKCAERGKLFNLACDLKRHFTVRSKSIFIHICRTQPNSLLRSEFVIGSHQHIWGHPIKFTLSIADLEFDVGIFVCWFLLFRFVVVVVLVKKSRKTWCRNLPWVKSDGMICFFFQWASGLRDEGDCDILLHNSRSLAKFWLSLGDLGLPLAVCQILSLFYHWCFPELQLQLAVPLFQSSIRHSWKYLQICTFSWPQIWFQHWRTGQKDRLSQKPCIFLPSYWGWPR